MKKGLVSVITSCYNSEEYLETYFESILSQTYRPLELFIVNDGSTDTTEEIAFKYKEKLEGSGISFNYIYHENAGVAYALNSALRHVTGEYLIWPDSDDILASDSIEKRVAFLRDNPSFEWVRSNGSYFDYDTKKRLYGMTKFELLVHTDIFMDLIEEKTYCACGCYMIKTETLKQFYPDMKIKVSRAGQNWQILIPIAGTYECGFIDEELYHVAVRRNSHSRQNLTLEQQLKRYDDLKDILLDAIRVSGRNDRDYKRIADLKYKRLYFLAYVDYSAKKEASALYKQLRKENVLGYDDKIKYADKFNKPLLLLLKAVNLFRRAAAKPKRIIKG